MNHSFFLVQARTQTRFKFLGYLTQRKALIRNHITQTLQKLEKHARLMMCGLVMSRALMKVMLLN